MKSKEKKILDATKNIGSKLADDKGGAFQNMAKNSTTGKWIPKNALGLTDSMMESLYSQAYRLYNTGKYDDSIELFRFLVLADPTEPKFAMGLAACFHMMKDYKNAINSYMICGMLEPRNPIPHFHESDCYLKINDPLSALISLEMAVKRAGNEPKYKSLVDRAKLTIEKLKKKVREGQPQE